MLTKWGKEKRAERAENRTLAFHVVLGVLMLGYFIIRSLI